MIKNILVALAAAVSNSLHFLFGRITWNTPPWVNYLKNTSSANPKVFWGRAAAFILVLITLFYTYHWYQTRPQPQRIIAEITAPKLTPNDKTLMPNPLNINFGIVYNGLLNNKPVAPLNDINKDVVKGISLTPSIAGVWHWESDSHLTFTPDNDWPAAQTYTIQFDQAFFTSGVTLDSLRGTFTTLPFEALITQFTFYQDPINPSVRQAVATINFSYPVDAASLEKNVSLAWQALKNGRPESSPSFKYTITYDDNKRTAYLHSESLSLPAQERYLELTLAKGIKAMTGPGLTDNAESASLLIPDAASYFKVSKIATSIVRNPQDRPEQVLTLETSLGVNQRELNPALKVYLLPQDKPATAAEVTKPNYQWLDTGEISPAILALSQPLALQDIPADRDYATLHSYKYNAKTPAFIYVTLAKGTRAFGDFSLAEDYSIILKVPHYPQEISFLHKGSLLALGTEEKLSVLVRGLGAVKFDIARVLPDDVNHLVTQTGGDFNNPYFIDTNFNQHNISEIFSDIQSFDATDAAKQQYTALDLAKYLSAKTNTGGPRGLFLLQAQGWDSENKRALPAQAKRLILITDLGIVAKDNVDASHDIFVQSITQGSPVNNASVAILGKNGLPLITRNTDLNGHANFPALTDFINEREPVVYLVSNGSDVAFMPYNRVDRLLNYSRFDIGGITSYNQDQAALTAYIFSDRGIYRPGDMAHIGMIIKQPYVLPQPAGLPLEVIVTDARGVTVKDEKITLNDSGYMTLDLQTTATSATGQYLVNLYIVKDNHASSLIGSSTLHVAEFLPDRMRISAHLSQEQTQGWVTPAGLSAKVGLWNLYGSAAANHRIGAKVLLTPQAVTFKAFPDYTFIDPLLNPNTPPKVFTDTLTETRTDGQGQAEFDLKLERFEKATYQLTVFVEGFEAEGGRSVTTQTTSLVSPLAYLVGYKQDGDLKFIKQNGQRNVHVIAVNPALKQQELANLKIQLFNQHPVTTLVKREDGTYHYQSIVQTTEISSKPFAIPAAGVNYTLPTQDIGDFLVAITDANGAELSRFKYNVVGSSQQPIPRNAELTVTLNKSEFAPGEKIEMQITAPYTGAGLITLERDKVYAYQWFKTNTSASVQTITIPSDFQGDGYVNIAFVRDLNSPEIFISPLSYHVSPFAVTHKEHDIKVDLSLPALARPGEALTITYQTDKPGKIIVFAVDEGILQVSRYQTPDPLKFFFQKHALEVNTMQMVDQILPKFMADRELSAIGGDDGESALNKNLNPFKRKTDAPVVYWSGIIDSDATPRQLTYQIPDYFNGSLRVMAVAVAANAVGATSKSTEVRGYFVINPNVPTFVAPGDEFEVTTSVANNVPASGTDAKVTVTLKSTPQLEIIGPGEQQVEITEGQEASVSFKVKATSLLGSAELQFLASLNDKTSKISSTLSVRPATAYHTNITSGYSTDAKTSLPLNNPLYPEYRKLEAAVSPSPLILVMGLQHYLNEYPYGCTEQLVSKVFPLLAMANQPWFNSDSKTITDKLQLTIQMLSQRQMSSGGFNYWPETGSTESNDFASVYALHFLTEAKAQGYSVPNDLFSLGIGYLKALATQDVSSLEQARLQAYAIYILTRNEIVTTNYVTHLQLALDKNPSFNWHKDITSAYLAAVYQLLKNQTEADKLINGYKPLTKQDNNATDFYSADLANAQYVYLISRHFPNRLQQLNIELIMSLVNALNNNSISTLLSSYTSLALASYHQFHTIPSEATLSISETMKDGKEQALSASNGMYQTVNIDMGASGISFINPKKQGYFYQLIAAGFDKNLPEKVIKEGIEVYREFRSPDNNVLTNVRLGEEIIVHIRARAIDNQYHDNIALVDLLPGGFEVVRDSVKATTMEYVDVREDRVIFFGGLEAESKEMVYRMKATNSGQFTVPPMLGLSMYNPLIKSLGVAGRISVEKQ